MLFTGRIRRWLILVLMLPLLFGLRPAPAFAGRDAGGNILIFWTDGDRLKAVTLMCVQGPRRPVGIVAIPVHIRINPGEGEGCTVAEAYGRLGRQGLTARLEELFKMPIGGYLAVDQGTLDKASNIIGPVVMADRVTCVSDVFEGTYTDGEKEPQWEIRSLAARLVEPQVLVKAPQLVYIFSSEVKTNLGYKNFWDIYRAVAEEGPEILRKKALTGRDYYVENRKYRDVPPDAWVSVLHEVTGA